MIPADTLPELAVAAGRQLLPARITTPSLDILVMTKVQGKGPPLSVIVAYELATGLKSHVFRAKAIIFATGGSARSPQDHLERPHPHRRFEIGGRLAKARMELFPVSALGWRGSASLDRGAPAASRGDPPPGFQRRTLRLKRYARSGTLRLVSIIS
jgi:hypothetical protein